MDGFGLFPDLRRVTSTVLTFCLLAGYLALSVSSRGVESGGVPITIQVGNKEVRQLWLNRELLTELTLVRSSYTSRTPKGDPVKIMAEGVLLTDYLATLEIPLTDVAFLQLKGINGTTVTVDVEALMCGERYFFTVLEESRTIPELPSETADPSSSVEPEDTQLPDRAEPTDFPEPVLPELTSTPAPSADIVEKEPTPKIPADAPVREPVPILLALASAEIPLTATADWDSLEEEDSPRLCYGQLTTDEVCAGMLLGELAGITVVLSEDSSFAGLAYDLMLTVRVGESIRYEQAYTMEELLQTFQLQREVYTSAATSGKPEVIIAEGIPISALMEQVGVVAEEMTHLRFFYENGLDSSFSKSFLLGRTRYAYPHLAELWKNDPGKISTAAAHRDAREVKPLLALTSFNEFEQADWNAMSNQHGFRICYGQLGPQEPCSAMYGDHIKRVELVLKDSSTFGMTEKERAAVAQKSVSVQDIDFIGTVTDRVTGESLERLPETLTVKVGYYGTNFVLRKAFTLSELRSLPLVKQGYSVLTGDGQVAIETAVGVCLSDLLKAAGIDQSSVESITFCYSKEGETRRLTLTRSYLLDTPRYCYPKLPQRWDATTGRFGTGAAQDAHRVNTLLALKDNWNVGATMPDYYRVSSENRFRLILGQSAMRAETASKMVRWIDTLEIRLFGAPPEETGGNVQTAAVIGGQKPSGQVFGESQQSVTSRQATLEQSPEAPVLKLPDGGSFTQEMTQTLNGRHLYEVTDFEQLRLPPKERMQISYPKWGMLCLFLGLGGGIARIAQYRKEK